MGFLQGSVSKNMENIVNEAENKEMFQNVLRLTEMPLFLGRLNKCTMPYFSCYIQLNLLDILHFLKPKKKSGEKQKEDWLGVMGAENNTSMYSWVFFVSPIS